LSYHVFGVNTFAYKFPSFLFSIGGLYSVYRLGKDLYGAETGRLSALLMGSSFAFILSNNDVRMDAILVAAIAFATWKLIAFIQQQRIDDALFASIGLGLAFSSKGLIGIVVPATTAIIYLLQRRDWKILLNWKWLLIPITTLLFIAPVIYAFYIQFNLHPEKRVRGMDHINGVKFILFGQGVERFGGNIEGQVQRDYLFFIYTFLWAFAPWSIWVYWAIVRTIRNFLKSRSEWPMAGTIIIVAILITLAGYKLPHYLNVIFPVAAVIGAHFIISSSQQNHFQNAFSIISWINVITILLITVVVNAWLFPVNSFWLIATSICLTAIPIYILSGRTYTKSAKILLAPVFATMLLFFLLNSNFYPKLLRYQGGNELAKAVKRKIDPQDIYFWKNVYSSSFNFYMNCPRREFNDSSLLRNRPTWLVYDVTAEDSILAHGYRIGARYVAKDFEVTMLTLKFLNPATRLKQCTEMRLGEISK
jgi:4-amino-4-deoxy-L-arabinose transferase-like glycosyltransferase